MAESPRPCTLVGVKKNKLASPERLVILGCQSAMHDCGKIIDFLYCCWSLERYILRTSVWFTFLLMEVQVMEL